MSTITEDPFINATRKATEAKGVGKRRGNRSAWRGWHPSSRYFLSIFLVKLTPPPFPILGTPLSRRRLNLEALEALLLEETWPRDSTER